MSNSGFALIRISQLLPALKAIEQLGGNVAEFMAAADLPPRLQEYPNQAVSGVCLRKLFAAAQQKLQRDDFGFYVAEQYGLESIAPIVADIVNQQLNLADSLGLLCKQLSLVVSNADFYIENTEQGLLWCRRGAPWIRLATDVIEQYSVAQIIYFIRLFTRDDWRPSRVFMERKDTQFDLAEVLKGSTIICDKPYTQIFIEEQYLTKKAKKITANKIIEYTDLVAESFEYTLATALIPYSDYRIPSIEEASRLMGVSIRCLQRRLKEDGGSFREVGKIMRFESAKVLMSDSTRTIAQVSEKLGYSQQAHFTRAFSQWSGMTPQQYRASMTD